MAIAGVPAQATYYVSPTGSDEHDGSLKAPFRTVQRALASTRRAAGSKPVIVLRGGTYFLPQTIRLEDQDSGLTIRAYKSEKPVLSGGMPIQFRERGGMWRVAVANWRKFTSLYVNGERRFRHRLPERGYYAVADALDPTPENKGKGYDRFKFHPGDIGPELAGTVSFHVIVSIQSSR